MTPDPDDELPEPRRRKGGAMPAASENSRAARKKTKRDRAKAYKIRQAQGAFCHRRLKRWL